MGENKSRWVGAALLALILLFVVVERTRLLDVPLERDEGEYAFVGQQLLDGIAPYKDAYTLKFPGTHLMYALVMGLFGQSVRGVHIGLMMVNCGAVVLMYVLLKRAVGGFVAPAAAAFAYAVLSLSPSVRGFAAHATHFAVLFALGGAVLLLVARDRRRAAGYFGAGLCMGAAVLMKQHAVFFALFGAAAIIAWHVSGGGVERPRPDAKSLAEPLAAYIAGAALPVAAVFLWLYGAGVFGRFWFWCFKYSASYVSEVPLGGAAEQFLRSLRIVADGFYPLWLLALAGVFVASRGLRFDRAFVFLFAACAFLSVCPGFHFRENYFITLLPAVAMFVGVAADFAARRTRSMISALIVLAIVVASASVGIAHNAEYFFSPDPQRVSRSAYGPNPFPESLAIADYIRARSAPDDRIAVFGSEPQILFYSHRPSATGYIYVYGLMEPQPYALMMQRQMASEVEAARPRFVMMVNVDMSWNIVASSDLGILNWAKRYLRQSYRQVGAVDIMPSGQTVYKWDREAAGYVPVSVNNVLIYERI